MANPATVRETPAKSAAPSLSMDSFRALRGAAIIAALICTVLSLWIWSARQRSGAPLPDIVARVQELNQLATVRYTIQKVVGLKEEKNPIGSESILLIIQAHVEAGVDLSQVHPEDITRQNGAIVVRLPEPKILNTIIDEKDTKVWDRQKTWWTPWVPYSLDLEQRARLAGIESVKQTALQDGILQQAETNAEKSIRALLLLTGAKEVRFIPSKLS